MDICRICHCEAEEHNKLISPCLCMGSLKYVHLQCLQKWIKSSDKIACELCTFSYIMTTNTRPFRQVMNNSFCLGLKVLCKFVCVFTDFMKIVVFLSYIYIYAQTNSWVTGFSRLNFCQLVDTNEPIRSSFN